MPAATSTASSPAPDSVEHLDQAPGGQEEDQGKHDEDDVSRLTLPFQAARRNRMISAPRYLRYCTALT
jgi:hypothetical protein